MSKDNSLRLIFDASEPTQQASLKLQWCVSPHALETLRNAGNFAPQLCIIVENGSREHEMRYVIPLLQVQTRIDFFQPGKHRIIAFIAPSGVGSEYFAKFFRRHQMWDGGFYVGLVNYWLTKNENLDQRIDRRPDVFGQDGIGPVVAEIDVADGFFAKPPPAWERWWINLWYERRPRDQCQLRRRMMLAFTIQPPVIFLWVLLTSIMRAFVGLSCVLFAQRGICWTAVVRPFAHTTRDVWEDTSSLAIFRRETILFSWPVLPVIPFIFVVSAGILFVFFSAEILWPLLPVNLPSPHSSVLQAIVFAGSYYGLLLVVYYGFLALVLMSSFVVPLVFKWMQTVGEKTRSFTRRHANGREEGSVAVHDTQSRFLPQWWKRYRGLGERTQRRQGRDEARMERFTTQVSVVACETRPSLGPISVHELPFALHRTPRLWYQEIKGAVCKPFAR